MTDNMAAWPKMPGALIVPTGTTVVREIDPRRALEVP